MQIETQLSKEMHAMQSVEPMLILNVTSPTQPKPSQVAQIADQFQESFAANYNWMSPRIIENHQQPIITQ